MSSENPMPPKAQNLIETQTNEKIAARWLEENRSAISDWNKYVNDYGLPLARFRQF